jgi:hypothetical protein
MLTISRMAKYSAAAHIGAIGRSLRPALVGGLTAASPMVSAVLAPMTCARVVAREGCANVSAGRLHSARSWKWSGGPPIDAMAAEIGPIGSKSGSKQKNLAMIQWQSTGLAVLLAARPEAFTSFPLPWRVRFASGAEHLHHGLPQRSLLRRRALLSRSSEGR